MKIAENHFMYRAGATIKELITPVASLHIEFLFYSRLYLDNSAEVLTTHPIFLAGLLNEESYPLFNRSTAGSGCYLTRDLYHDNGVLKELSQRIQIHYSIGFHRVTDNFIERIALGANSNSIKLERLLGNIDLLENFNDYFRIAANDLISQAKNEKFSLPKSLVLDKDVRSINLRMLNQKRAIESDLARKNYWPFLSQREFDCLYCLAHGMQAKETAEILEISARTVEVHLAQVRYKMNCRNKLELVQRYWTWHKSER